MQGVLLAVPAPEGAISLYDRHSWKIVGSLTGSHTQHVNTLAFSSDGASPCCLACKKSCVLSACQACMPAADGLFAMLYNIWKSCCVKSSLECQTAAQPACAGHCKELLCIPAHALHLNVLPAGVQPVHTP